MSSAWDKKHGLPFLPGYAFRDYTKSAFHRPQTLSYKNGCPVPRRPVVGIGRNPLSSEPLLPQRRSGVTLRFPDMTYPPPSRTALQSFTPLYVTLDKKVLCFDAYFREDVTNSSSEEYRVRPVVIYYYLEDDTMAIVEPRVQNSGLLQGQRLKRQRVPKDERGGFYTWKDLNVGVDLEVFNFKYRVTQCDAFTKTFLESEGIAVNAPEPTPQDPSSEKRKVQQHPRFEPAVSDSLHQFLTMDGKVLSFSALWEDADAEETRPVTIRYFLVDDTVEVREVRKHSSGQMPFSALMRRLKVPKKMKSGTFPSCVMEISHRDVEEYYSPRDFQLGQRVKLLGRTFRLYDCNDFTKNYYARNHPDLEMKPEKVPETPDKQQKEAGMVQAHKILPRAANGKVLENHNKVLRYTVQMDSLYPEDEGRLFVLSYSLFDKTISIFERPFSGFSSGFFLRNTRVPKPGSSKENPEFYSPADFAIGATVHVFNRRFVVTDADLYVLNYLESISDQIPSQTLESLREKFNTLQPAEKGEETESS